MRCEHVLYQLDSDKFAALKDDEDPLLCLTRIECDSTDTVEFDRGTASRYPEFRGVIRVCEPHRVTEQMQKELNEMLRDGTLFQED